MSSGGGPGRPASTASGSTRPGASHEHAPATPSGLRQTFNLSPTSDEGTSLLHGQHAHDGPCNHGTFSPRAETPVSSIFGTSDRTTSEGDADHLAESQLKKDSRHKTLSNRLKSRTMNNSSALAQQHGFKDSPLMYLSYYVPCIIWIRQYKMAWLKGDLIAAVTIASMYLPMALSYADNLAHVPPINGLYAFVFNPIIYAILGSCPQMVVGPEAAGSLLVGSVVKNSIDKGDSGDDSGALHAQIAGVAVGMAGASVFIMGLIRLGFIDSVLSRPFLRGFISAIGVVIFIDQLIPTLGLATVQSVTPGASHGSTVEKLEFFFTHLDQMHRLSAIVGGVCFVVVMVLRETKRRVQSRYPSAAYFPDRLLVVVITAVMAWKLGWEEKGVSLLGNVRAGAGQSFAFRNPFQISHMKHIRDSMSTSFLIGMLGFFESSVAAKSLGGDEIIQGMQLSPNRELVALGAANLVGSFFMAIPAFGGYGRSKVNASTGGKSPMSSIFLGIITVICTLYLLPWFYYIPKPILSALIMVVAYSLVEEAPHDIAFFWRIRGWLELSLMAIIVLITIFFSLNMGIAIGIAISLLQVVYHSTRPRIQILGRIPGTQRFENAEDQPERLEFIEGCLIVKIPEPLTFANTGELKNRLRRLEYYGMGRVHPALPRVRPSESNRNVIFDIHGVTSIDGSGIQVLEEIVHSYRDRGVRVFFSRAPSRTNSVWKLMERSGIIDLIGGAHHFTDDVHDALRMTEMEAIVGDPCP